jgi:hypothetical protein
MTTPLAVFKAIWTAEVVSLPYVETVNTPVDASTLPGDWGSAILQPQTRTDVTLGSRPWVEEKGTFVIGLFTRERAGPSALDAAVDELRAVFHGAAQDGLHIESIDGPHDIDPEVDGEWWRLALTANYTFHSRRDASDALHGGWSGFPA